MEVYENEINDTGMELREQESIQLHRVETVCNLESSNSPKNHVNLTDRKEQEEQQRQDELVEKLLLDAEEKLNSDSACQSNKSRSRRKRTRNPFIAFFLGMYSRRPRARAADVARQAGRQWCRMSDRQRRRYAVQILQDNLHRQS